MSDTAYTVFQHYGTNAQRTAFTPSPPATGQPIYLWYETDTGSTFLYDTSWHNITGAGGGVTASGTLTSGKLIQGNGGSVVTVNATTGIPKLASGTISAATDGTDYLSPTTGIKRLSQVVTAASQATVDFTSIPSTFTNLVVMIYAQDTTADSSDSAIYLKINNDGTSGNYTATQRGGASNGAGLATTLAATANGSQAGLMPNASTTGSAGNSTVTITGYASTTFHKLITYIAGDSTTTFNGGIQVGSFRWKDTSAINRLTFTAGGTAFTNGSIFTLYGWA